MNNLSWFIYLVQLADGIGILLIWCVVFTIVGFAARIVCTNIRAESAYSNTTSSGGADYKARKDTWSTFSLQAGRYAALAAFFTFAAIATPSRQTLLLIAGSEMGERLIKSETVNGVVNPGMDLLKNWIKRESEKIAKEASK